MEEIWKDIEGYSGYKISNLGRVKSYRKDTNGYLMSPAKTALGYYQVELQTGGKYKGKLYIDWLRKRLFQIRTIIHR